MQCQKHPKYQAIQKPRIDCKRCWEIYNRKHEKPDGTFEYPPHFMTQEMFDRLSGY